MRNKAKLLRIVLFRFVLGALISSAPHVIYGQGESYLGSTTTGTAYAMSGRLAGRSAPFRLIIRRYASPQEIQSLNEALRSGGQDEMLRVLTKLDCGRIEVGSGVGVPANVITAEQQANGETKIIVIYERSIRFSELRYGTRSQDYKFGYAELFVGRSAQGQGTLIPAAKIRLRDGTTWEVEDFGTFPARLLGLRVHGRRVPR